MMITGIGFLVVGASLFAAGLGVAASGAHCTPTPTPLANGGQANLCGPMTGQQTGMAILASGLIGLGLGLPMTVLGASDVPRAESGARLSAPPALARLSAPPALARLSAPPALAKLTAPRAVFALGLRGASFGLNF
jgi:hypothetical protein